MMHSASHPMQEKASRSSWSFWLRVSAPLFVMCLLLTAGLLAGRAISVQAEESGVVPDAPGSISGVARTANNAPAAKIQVMLFRRDSYGQFYPLRWTNTADNGSYRFGLLSTGIYRLYFSDPAQQLGSIYYPTASSLSGAQDIPVAGVDVTNVDVTLPLAGSIGGTVTGVNVGQQSQYVSLFALKGVAPNWETVAYTYFTLTPVTPTVNYILKGLAPGVYKICAYDYYSGGYLFLYHCYDNVAAGIQYANDVAVVGGSITPDIDIVMGGDADLASISGRVTSLNGSALPTVTVELLRSESYFPNPSYWTYHRSTQTNASGQYTFAQLIPDSYKLRFVDRQSGHIEEFFDDVTSIEAATPITVARFEQRTGVDVSLTPGGVISGHITILGEGIGGSGSVYVYAATVEGSSASRHVRSSSGGGGGGRVYSGESDSMGNYRIGGLPTGVYVVHASAYLADSGQYFDGSYRTEGSDAATPITVSGAVTIPNIDIDLGQGAFEALIAGRVTDSKAQPISSIQVEIFRNNFDSKPFYYTATDADGRYSIGGLLDGAYTIRFYDPASVYANEFYSGALASYSAAILYPTGAAPLTQVNASLLKVGGVSGRAVYTDGLGAPNVNVTLMPDGYYQSDVVTYTTTDVNGAYTFNSVRPGRYVVSFYDPTHPYGPYFYHQRLDFYQADRVIVEEGAITPNIDQIIGGAPTALDVENEPQAPVRMYLPLVAR